MTEFLLLIRVQVLVKKSATIFFNLFVRAIDLPHSKQSVFAELSFSKYLSRLV